MTADDTSRECRCAPCPGRGNDGHGMTHCAECCFGTGVEAEFGCPTHHPADDTSREALVERLTRAMADAENEAAKGTAFEGWMSAGEGDYDLAAAAAFDAVVMPLVEERDDLLVQYVEDANALRDERDAVIEERDTWHERWRQLMRDHEAVVKDRDAAEAAHQALTDAVRGLTAGRDPRIATKGDLRDALRAILTEHGARDER